MKRREILKNLYAGTVASEALPGQSFAAGTLGGDYTENTTNTFQSTWHLLPNMLWIGENCWYLVIDNPGNAII